MQRRSFVAPACRRFLGVRAAPCAALGRVLEFSAAALAWRWALNASTPPSRSASARGCAGGTTRTRLEKSVARSLLHRAQPEPEDVSAADLGDVIRRIRPSSSSGRAPAHVGAARAEAALVPRR